MSKAPRKDDPPKAAPPDAQPVDKDARADMRRAALRKVLEQHRMSPAEAARIAGMGPNALYNFLNGHSASLSQATYEKLAQALPGVTPSMLVGMDAGAGAGGGAITVRGEARAGTLRASFDLAHAKQMQVQVPITDEMRLAGAFGMIVRWPGAEEIYPRETILVCIPPSNFESPLTVGRRVILQRIVDKTVEVTVRQLTVTDGSAWLWPRSTNPRYQTPIMMPWPSDGTKMWRDGDTRYGIAGIVVMACIPEV